MPKKGRTDAYWNDQLRQFANGEVKFGVGQTPGKPKWKEALKKVMACPRHGRVQTIDLLGRTIPCKCGYHETVPQNAASTPYQSKTTSQQSADSFSNVVTTQVHSTSAHPSQKTSQQSADSFSNVVTTQVLSAIAHPSQKTSQQSADSFSNVVTTQVLSAIAHPSQKTSQQSADSVSHTTESASTCIECGLCQKSVSVETYNQHLSEWHADIKCDKCGSYFKGERALANHMQDFHFSVSKPLSSEEAIKQKVFTPTPVPSANLGSGQQFLPSQFRKVIQESDQAWIATILYEQTGSLRDKLPNQNWYHPPPPPTVMRTPPYPGNYFRQRMFLWAPMRMWNISLYCPKCKTKLQYGGIYPKAREVVDVESRYYLIGADYPRCGKCKIPVCPWSPDVINQLDPYHRNLFPAVLTKNDALDKKCVTLMKPRTLGNSSSFIQQAIHEIHSENWVKQCLNYLTDCDLHKKRASLTGIISTYRPPPAFRSIPLAQWFETSHANEILNHADEMKAVITSTYGKVLKLDSTKKVTKKLAGDVGKTASWMTNIANEYGLVLNSVLTTGEGPAMYKLCQGIVNRYREAKEPEPQAIYVDKDCCENSPVLDWFHPWKCHVRLDMFHFMRRFTKGLTTEHHPLYGTFCSKFSSCVFEWDQVDFNRLREAKKAELKSQSRVMPTEQQISAAITTNELARHCRRRTRDPARIKILISELLDQMWDLTDTTGVRLISDQSMKRIWEVQQKHLECIQDPPGVELYTKTGTLEKGGKTLDVLRCARGSSSLESFHRHQCAFIPGWRSNALHTQMYMVEGCSRWNVNRAREALDLTSTSQTRLYDVRLMANANSLGQKVLGMDLLPEFRPPGISTDEKIAVEYLLDQSGEGDLRPCIQEDVGKFLPEMNLEEAAEDELVDLANTVGLLEYDIDLRGKPKEFVSSDAKDRPGHLSPCERCGVMLGTGEMVVHLAKHMVDSDSVPMAEHTVEWESEIPMADPDSDGPSSPDHEAIDSVAQPSLERPINEYDQEVESSPDHEAIDSVARPSHERPPINEYDQEVQSSTEKESCYDSNGEPGWDKVDNLAEYLVSRSPTVTALTASEVDQIVLLYDRLLDIDKKVTKYTKKSKDVLAGPWRASRKRSGTEPGVQAAERLYMTHGQAAQSPTANRISWCLAIRLMKMFLQARNRPKDRQGKILPLPQAIVQRYSHIQQLLGDNQTVQASTNLVLVTVNTTTISNWLDKRQKGRNIDALLQGTSLPEPKPTAAEPLPQAKSKATQHHEHGHRTLQFTEPENRQGESVKRPMKRKARLSKDDNASFTQSAPNSPSTEIPMWQPGNFPQQPQGYPGWYGWPPYSVPPFFSPGTTPVVSGDPSTPSNPMPSFVHPSFGQHTFSPPPYGAPCTSTSVRSQPSAPPRSIIPAQTSRHREWRQRKAEKEDQERIARGEAPKKRYKRRETVSYNCTFCGQQKVRATGHTQIKGDWYCPSSGISVEDWKKQLKK